MKHDAVVHHELALAEARPRLTGRLFFYVTDRFLLLPLGALVALAWANSAPDGYFRFAHAAAFPVNEIAMGFFLALVTQEIWESLMPAGALHTWRRWALPIVAAAGGVAGAATTYLAYVAIEQEAVLAQAWPMACAIDVAAAYYVLKIVWPHGRALPFVLLLALATDAIGVAVVALRPHGAVLQPGGIVLFVAALAIAGTLRQRQVRSFWPYLLVCGPLSWFGLYWEGVHPALAFVPIVPFLPHRVRREGPFVDRPAADDVRRFEYGWNEVVQVILFAFALVNAGIMLRGYGTGTWAVAAAALVGRPAGILIAVAVATFFGLQLPRRIGWRGLLVIALATSSGFTFALFFATGLIPVGPVLAEIKLGSLLSVAAAGGTLAAARLLRVGRFAR